MHAVAAPHRPMSTHVWAPWSVPATVSVSGMSPAARPVRQPKATAQAPVPGPARRPEAAHQVPTAEHAWVPEAALAPVAGPVWASESSQAPVSGSVPMARPVGLLTASPLWSLSCAGGGAGHR